MIKEVLIHFLLLFLANFGQDDEVSGFTLDDQRNSNLELSSDIVFEYKGSDFSSPKDFLRKHTFMVISVSTPEGAPVPEATHSVDETGHISLDIDVKSDGQVNKGSAFSISKDGYLLTAYHVIADQTSWVLNSTHNYSEEDGFVAASRSRLVFKSEEADFAILKVDFETPNYLKLRKSSLRTPELVFSGGLHNETGAGYYKPDDSYVLKDSELRLYEIVTSIPTLYGDSGSPVIDTKGRACGVSKSANGEVSHAAMLDPKVIRRIIKEDRKANQSSHTTPASAPR